MNKLGKDVIMKEDVILGDNITIEDNVYIDYHCIIRDNVTIKEGSTIGANCILGEYQMDFYKNARITGNHPLIIGRNSIIRSNTVIYGDTVTGDELQTGHHVTIRENTQIGSHVSVGTLSDIQGDCKIGNYVRLHSNVFVAMGTMIEDFVWIMPGCILTNDPTPPSTVVSGVTVKKFAVIAAGSIVLPGNVIESDSLIAAGAVVTKDVEGGIVVAGNPARKLADISEVKNRETGLPAYPWRYHFNRGMPWEESDYNSWEKKTKIKKSPKVIFKASDIYYK